MKKSHSTLLILTLLFVSCQNRNPEVVEKKPVKITKLTQEERIYEAFGIMTKNPKNFIYSYPLTQSIFSKNSPPTKEIQTLKWKRNGTSRSIAELNNWLKKIHCESVIPPEWMEMKTNKQDKTRKKDHSILFGSYCIQGSFKNHLNPTNERMLFQKSPQSKVWVQSLGYEGHLPYHQSETLHFVELPLEQEQLKLVLIVPKNDQDPNTAFQSLNKSELELGLENLKEKKVKLEIPPFSVKSPIFTKTMLQLAGMDDAFQTTSPPEEVIVYFPMTLNEFGINQISKEPKSKVQKSRLSIEITKKIIFDQPFLFVIKNTDTKETIAMGKIYAP